MTDPGGPADPAAVDVRFAEYRRTRDRRLRNALVEDHRAVAEHAARRFPNRSLPPEDVLQVAYLGLVRAVERFDPDRGFQFSSFAEPTIMGELKRHLRDHAGGIRLPRRTHDLHLAARRATDELTDELGRAPTIAQVAERVGADADDVALALDAGRARTAVSLSAPARGAHAEGDDATVADGLGAVDESIERVADQVTVAELVADLPEREQQIVRLRFEGRLSQAEIAERVGISQMHVSRLLRRTLDHLRRTLDPDEDASLEV